MDRSMSMETLSTETFPKINPTNLLRLTKYTTRRNTVLLIGVSKEHLPQTNQDQFHVRNAPVPLPCREEFYSHLESKVGNILTKTVALCINLNIDGFPIASRSHRDTHPSHSQTSLLLPSSLSSGTPPQLHPVC